MCQCFVACVIKGMCNVLIVSLLQVGKNAMLCKSVFELLQRGRDEIKVDDLKAIENKVRCII